MPDNSDYSIAFIDDIHKSDDEIYADFESNQLGKPPLVRQDYWGQYGIKPKEQIDWEARVKWAAQTVAAVSDFIDDRPRIRDLNSGLTFLIDSGAAISIFPKAKCPKAKKDLSSLTMVFF